MKGEQTRISLAKNLLKLNQTLQETVDYLHTLPVTEKSQHVIWDLLSVQKQIIAEYDEVYLLLKAEFLLNREDFKNLKLKYLDLKAVPKTNND